MDAVLEIWVRGSLQAHGFIEESYWERQKERLRENLLSHAITAVYCDPTTERIGGFISLVENFIVALYVAPEEQGRGIGHNLLQRAKYLYPVLELSVYTENRAALSFYLREGFQIVLRRIDQATGHEEALMIHRPAK